MKYKQIRINNKDERVNEKPDPKGRYTEKMLERPKLEWLDGKKRRE